MSAASVDEMLPEAPNETLMWEVRCDPGRGEDLLAWVRREMLPVIEADEWIAAYNVYRSATPDGERICVIADCNGTARVAPKLPAPPPDLVARDPHQWVFERLDVG